MPLPRLLLPLSHQEVPFDEPRFEASSFLSYYEIELQLRMVTRVGGGWDLCLHL